MFAKRFDTAMRAIRAQNKEIAEYSGSDPATISRFRTGKRTPYPQGNAVQRLVDGMILYADTHKTLPELTRLLEADGFLTDESNLANNLLIWLFTEASGSKGASGRERVLPYSNFSRKLNELMLLTGISNARLGRLISLDPSQICRLRNGQRTPKSNPLIISQICQALITELTETQNLKELCDLIKIPEKSLANEDALFLSLRKWLCDIENDSHVSLHELLQNIDSFSPVSLGQLPSFSSIATNEVLHDTTMYYRDNAGLQQAVIRFLSCAISSGAKQLFLYSDQNTNWLMEDKVFLAKWFSLMMECAKRGIHIQIIHNIERNRDEMLQGIRNWLPLYMTGMIEPYYCIKKNGTRFSHTLFLCPDTACITAYHTSGISKDALYCYHTDKDALIHFRTMYDELLTSCRPLVRTHHVLPSASPESGVEVEPYSNIRISVQESSVTITRLSEPRISFVLLHPLMHDAFQSFIASMQLL